MEDGFTALRGCGPRIKGKLQVAFVNLGVAEPGVDSGGLVKEFLEEVALLNTLNLSLRHGNQKKFFINS